MTPIFTAQTPNDVNITTWQLAYLRYFGFTSVQWEEAEAGRPFLYTVYGFTVKDAVTSRIDSLAMWIKCLIIHYLFDCRDLFDSKG